MKKPEYNNFRTKLCRANATDGNLQARREKDKVAKAEKKANETEEEKLNRQEKNKITQANKKAKEAQEEKLSRKEKEKIAQLSKRKQETVENSGIRKEKVRVAKATKRKNETAEEGNKRKMKETKAKENKRNNETAEEGEKRKMKETKAKEKKRAAVKSKPASLYAARNAQKVLYCEQIVHELKDTKEDIGRMNIECNECGALKWKSETPTVCCNNGKVNLAPFPNPPQYLQHLWTANTVES